MQDSGLDRRGKGEARLRRLRLQRRDGGVRGPGWGRSYRSGDVGI